MTEEQQLAATCGRDEQQQFNFWIGEWEVSTPDGELAGHNTISRVAGGCALREEWRGVRGLRGTSLNAWSPATGWHQTWADSSGTVLLLDGGLRDGAMVLEGRAPLPGVADGAPLRHRITWSVVDAHPDRLRQHWETSTDGEAWETAFDGRYRREGT